MGFGFIKSNQGTIASGTSGNVTIQAVPKYALVVVTIKSNANITGISVTDNVGNTYAQASGSVGSGSNFISQFYGVALISGAVTISISWTTTAALRVTVDQFNGGKKTNATVFDKVATNTGTGVSASVSLSPSNSGELVVAGVGMTSGTSGVTIGSNYLAGTNNTSATTEYRAVSTTTETAPLSWTGSTAWAEVASAFIPDSSPGNFLQFI